MTKTRNFVLAAALVAAVPFGAAQAQDTITYGSYLSARHATNTKSVEPWFRAVEQATNGSLKFQLMADGTLVSGRNSLQGIRDGVVDMSTIVDFYTPNELKTSVILTELSMLGEDAMVMTGAINEMQVTQCPSCQDEAAENNLQILALYASTPYHMICNQPLSSAADFKGKRIRATGAWAVLTTALGATPVNITTGEMYEAMQRGQIDCTLVNVAGLTNYSLAEVAKYVVDMPMGTFHGAHVYNMNSSVWAKRTDVEKAAMVDNLPQALANLVEGAEAEDIHAREEAKKHNIVFLEPAQDLKDAMENLRKDEVKRAIELAKTRGVKDAEKVIGDFQVLIQKWTDIKKETGADAAKFAEALKTNVYDKFGK